MPVENIIIDHYTFDLIQYCNGDELTERSKVWYDEFHPNTTLPDRETMAQQLVDNVNRKIKKNLLKNLMHVPYRREAVII